VSYFCDQLECPHSASARAKILLGANTSQHHRSLLRLPFPMCLDSVTPPLPPFLGDVYLLQARGNLTKLCTISKPTSLVPQLLECDFSTCQESIRSSKAKKVFDSVFPIPLASDVSAELRRDFQIRAWDLRSTDL